MAQRLRHVAVEHNEHRLFACETIGEPALDAFGKGEQALMRRHAGPPQRERDLALALLEIERDNMIADSRGEFLRIDGLGGLKWRL